jgi:hypothetical protein
MSVYPITFSIPSEKIVSTIPSKTKILAQINPMGVGKHTYIYDKEDDYYNDYKKSLFAITRKKGGWDCMRHYEIIACGCIPVFENLEFCPKNTLFNFPKELLIKSKFYFDLLNKKYNFNNNNSILILSNEEINICNNLINNLLEYARNNLTTKSISKYILSKVNLKVDNILYISNPVDGDYLRCLVLHGFKELFGKQCEDYPFLGHIYKYCDENSDIDYKILHGMGFSYTNLINKELHEFINDDTIKDNIIKKKYDLVIYSSLHKNKPLFEIISKYYQNNQIIFLCGEDIHQCICNEYVKKGYNVFVREL